MNGAARSTSLILAAVACVLFASPLVTTASAQAKPRPRPAAARPSRSVQIGGYAMVGRVNLAAVESFDAILGQTSGPIFGGGARVGLPFGGLFVDVGAWRYRDEGERVFVSNGVIYPLNVPVEVTLTPLEITAGWRFRVPRVARLTPYVGGGLTSMTYRETSAFSATSEDVEETFSGYHLMGGAEVRLMRWIGAAAEVTWSTVPDSIGQGGVSAAFNEDDLGGTTVRFKITIGR
jgi:opacity protein-like surface antigen